MTSIITASGRLCVLPEHIDSERVLGLDEDGRIVVNDFGADADFVFGLTLCCDAYDKGVEDGVVCRACYSDSDIGSYIYRNADGEFPGIDRIATKSE